MFMALQASKTALCAIVLLLAVLLALSGVMLAGQSLWGSRAKADVEPRPPCGARGGGPGSAGQARAMAEQERRPLNSSQILQDLTHQGETPC
ncbi:MAG: hypothetical protein WA161_16275 [Pseudomonas sp.]|uniref:hypothetical protein n=1 Tax=Pseudomonas sp. TaxID=306 RepID=UPI003BB5F5CE